MRVVATLTVAAFVALMATGASATTGPGGLDNLGTGATTIKAGGQGVHVTLADDSTVTGEKLLVAAGRKPNLDDIGLDTVGLDPSARSLTVDDTMQVQREDGPVALESPDPDDEQPSGALLIRTEGAKVASTTVEGRELKLSNLDKLLYPQARFTKRDVIHYYAAVAAAIAAPRTVRRGRSSDTGWRRRSAGANAPASLK